MFFDVCWNSPGSLNKIIILLKYLRISERSFSRWN